MGWISNLLSRNNKVIPFYQYGLKPFSLNKLEDEVIINQTYTGNVDAYAMVRKIVESSKTAEWIVEERTSDGWELLEDTPIHDLMAKPNVSKQYTWDDIQEMLLIYLLTTGNSYLYGEKLGATIAELDVLPSQAVDVTTNSNFFMPNVKYDFSIGSTTRKYESEDIEHIMLFNPDVCNIEDSYNGLSVFEVACRVVQMGNDRWDAAAFMMQNRGVYGMVTDRSNTPMTPTQAEIVQQAFDRDNGGTHNQGRVRVTNKDLNFVSMAMSSTDLQLVEQGVATLRAMCNVFGLDSSLFNDPANKTFNNRLEAEKALYTNAVIPISNKVAKKHTNYIASNLMPDRNIRMRQDFSKTEALQKDKKQEAEKDKIVMEGINTVLGMPISMEAKKQLIMDSYDVSEEFLNELNELQDVVQD